MIHVLYNRVIPFVVGFGAAALCVAILRRAPRQRMVSLLIAPHLKGRRTQGPSLGAMEAAPSPVQMGQSHAAATEDASSFLEAGLTLSLGKPHSSQVAAALRQLDAPASG